LKTANFNNVGVMGAGYSNHILKLINRGSIMKSRQITQAVLIAISMMASSAVLADNMSKDSYKAAKDRVESEYKTDKANCKSLSGNAKDICMAEASGKEKVAKAQ